MRGFVQRTFHRFLTTAKAGREVEVKEAAEKALREPEERRAKGEVGEVGKPGRESERRIGIHNKIA